MADYVQHLECLEAQATPDDPTPALDAIVRDHQATGWKTLSVFVRDCVGGNCFPIDSRVEKEVKLRGLPVDERLLVRLSLAVERNPRQVARMFYEAGGEVGQQADENTVSGSVSVQQEGMARMTIYEALDQVGRQLQQQYGQRPIPVGELRRQAARLGGYAESGILPSDFCYNRTNDGIPPANRPMFLYVDRGLYRYLGPDYPYNGPLMHQPKGKVARQVGEWRDGILYMDGEPTLTATMTPRERVVAATHEAAHAVIARYFGFMVDTIEIGIDGDRLGHAPFQPILPDEKTEAEIVSSRDIHSITQLFLRRVAVYLAGPNAQELYCHYPAFDGAGADMIDAVDSAKVLGDLIAATSEGGKSAAIHTAVLIQQAIQLVLRLLQQESVRTAIETVAACLMREGSLSGERATELIDGILKLGDS